MADRTVSVKLQAEIGSYMASLSTASTETQRFGRGIMESATRNQAEFELLGRGLLGIGAAAIAGLGMATKAAIDWESAFAGVEKTVDGTATQMAELEGELRDMAKELPASHEEIAAVAEAAGQLGIQQENVADFTRTMIDLGEATNLSAEEAATGLARFSNIMGTAQSDVDRMGSVLVDLGNNAATTESDILELSTRMAAAGSIAGLSEADVMGFASAMTSVGVNAEAGGTAMSKVFSTINDAVINSSEELDTLAEVAGVSAEEFARSFEEDPARAVATFIEGLGRMNDAGESTTGVLDDLSLTDQRLMRALLSTASAGDLLVEQLERGNAAWSENSALTEEAEKRYETAAAQISMAWNSIKDAAIEVGSVIAPIVSGVAGAVGTLADAFGSLPGPVHTAVSAITGIGGAATLATGAFLLALPRIQRTREAMQALGLSFRGIRRVAIRGAAGIGIIAGGLSVLNSSLDDAPADVDALAMGLDRWAKSGQMSGEMARIFGDDIGNLNEALKNAADDGFTRFAAETIEMIPMVDKFDFSVGKAVDRMQGVDEALAQMVATGNADQASAAFDELARMADEQGVSIDRLREILPKYAAEQEKSADQTEAAAGLSGDAAGAIAELGVETENAVPSIEELNDALDQEIEKLREAGELTLSKRDALRELYGAYDDASEAANENGRTLDTNTEAGRNNQEALDNIASSAHDAAAAMIENGDSADTVGSKMNTARDRFIETAQRMGLTADEARDLADDLGLIPGDYVAVAELRDEASAGINEVDNKLDNLDGKTAETFVTTYVDQVSRKQVPNAGGMFPSLGYASGGPVAGPGTSTSDSVPAMLSRGEHVWSAAEVRAMGGHDVMEQLRSAARQGRMPGFADGGAVMGGAAAAVASGGDVHIVVKAPHYVGSHEELARTIRKAVRVEGGGDVQKAFGRRERAGGR